MQITIGSESEVAVWNILPWITDGSRGSNENDTQRETLFSRGIISNHDSNATENKFNLF